MDDEGLIVHESMDWPLEGSEGERHPRTIPGSEGLDKPSGVSWVFLVVRYQLPEPRQPAPFKDNPACINNLILLVTPHSA